MTGGQLGGGSLSHKLGGMLWSDLIGLHSFLIGDVAGFEIKMTGGDVNGLKESWSWKGDDSWAKG